MKVNDIVAIKNGGKLSIIARNQSDLASVSTIIGDLNSKDGIEKICSQIENEDWDILINLAGVQYFGFFENQAPEHLYESMYVNLLAPIRLIQSVLPRMKARSFGQIVNIGSIFGSINFAHFATYSSAKSGLRGLSQSLRRELAATPIGVTYVAPRAVNTPFNSAKVQELKKLTKMNMDEPELVASRIIKAIERDEKDVFIGNPESFFVRLNGLFPSLVDGALRSKDILTASLFK